MLWLVVGWQAVGRPVLHADERLHAAPSCSSAEPEGGEVIVCGARDPDRFRLRPLSPRWERSADGPPRAAVDVPGLGRLSAEAEQGSIGGIPSPRAMIRLTVPF